MWIRCSPSSPRDLIVWEATRWARSLPTRWRPQLQSRGHSVELLALFDHPGPDARTTFADWIRVQRITLARLGARDKLNYIWRGLRWRISSQQKLPRWVRQWFKTLTTSGDWAYASRRVEILESSLKAIDDYVIKRYDGRVTLFRARQGPPRIHSDPRGGWSSVALGGVKVYEVPGDHMSMFEEPHLDELAAAVREVLRRQSAAEPTARPIV